MTLLAAVKQNLLVNSCISESDLARIMGTLMMQGVDFADIYLQSTTNESWVLDDGIVKGGSFDLDRGVGLRAISGEKTGYAYSDDVSLQALSDAANAARSIIRQGQSLTVPAWQSTAPKPLYPSINPLSSFSEADKVALLEKIDQLARSEDARVTQVMASLAGSFETVLIMNSDGRVVPDIRPLVRLNVQVVVEEGGRREQGYAGGGIRGDYSFFTHEDKYHYYVKKAVAEALIMLDAIPAPAGSMPVVLGPGWPGVLLHEAIGHGLEGDFNRKGTSAFTGMIGERVASPLCTIVDDGTLQGLRGSLTVDDEGTESHYTTLIEGGILKGYMLDKMNAALMNTASTGNGRRESYEHAPLPRMTNTYMLPGKDEPEDIIRSVKKGIYAVNFGGGQVDISSGKFVFSASEAYLIEEGKVTAPIKGATLIGCGPEVLGKVSMVGHDLSLDDGVGICGKDGQTVPVGVGQPTLKVDEMTVGGTEV